MEVNERGGGGEPLREEGQVHRLTFVLSHFTLMHKNKN